MGCIERVCYHVRAPWHNLPPHRWPAHNNHTACCTIRKGALTRNAGIVRVCYKLVVKEGVGMD